MPRLSTDGTYPDHTASIVCRTLTLLLELLFLKPNVCIFGLLAVDRGGST